MAYFPPTGSVVAFQSNPSSLLTGSSIIGLTPVNVTSIPSIYGNISGSVATWINSSNASVITVIQGSVAVSVTPAANQSVSGAVSVSNFPTTQNVSGSVVATQGTNPWTVTSSIAGGIFPISGSVAATITNTNINVSGSVAAFLAGSTNASVITVGTAVANQSVSGTVGASVIGTVPVTQVTNPWTVVSSIAGGIFPISGSVAATIVGTPNINVAGSVISFQGGAPWLETFSNSSILAVPVGSVITVGQGSIATVIIGGSIAATFIPPANQSVSGTVQTQVQASVAVVIIGGSILTSSTANQSVSGTILIGNAPSIYGNISGSVVAYQGVSPWLETFSNSSIISINAGSVVSLSSGSVIAVFQSSSVITTWKDSSVLSVQKGTWLASVTGTTAANSASIISGLGFVTMGVRNDGMGSVLSTTDGFYGPFATGSWGDQIVSLAPASVWTSGIGSVYTGVPQPIIGSVSGRFINITGVQIANASANNVYLTFYGTGIGSVAGSIIGYTVAPASGGSNINYPIPLRTQVSQPFQASVSGVASVLISAQGFYSKT